jgi:hypothetical protein
MTLIFFNYFYPIVESYIYILSFCIKNKNDDTNSIFNCSNSSSKYKKCHECYECYECHNKIKDGNLYFAMDKSFCTDYCRNTYINKDMIILNILNN